MAAAALVGALVGHALDGTLRPLALCLLGTSLGVLVGYLLLRNREG